MSGSIPPPPPGFPGAPASNDSVPPPPPGFPGAASMPPAPPMPTKTASKTKQLEPTPPKEPYDPAHIARVESSSDAPLPANWSQHITSQGIPYYWHAIEGTSTWIRPGVAIRPPQGARIDPATGKMVLPEQPPVSAVEPGAPKKPKKEKPKDKEPVEGTDWIRVTTTEDNVFFMNKATKTSVWSVPDELKDWEAARAERVKADKEAEAESQRQAAAKRKAADEQEQQEAEQALAAEQQQQAEEAKPPKKKKAKVVHSLQEMYQQDPEMAKQVAGALKDQEDEPSIAEIREREARQREEEQMTTEEGKALYMALLGEKDINPMAPWDAELPKFINDPRYHAVKNGRERRTLFDEFCKHKIREQRAQKKNQPKQDPAVAYRSLLVAEVTSTRYRWDDFRQTFKKDNRFREFGRDDREREKAFKNWLKELGELKRADAKSAEDKFTRMLTESLSSSDPDSLGEWKDVRPTFKDDPRFDAVKSGTRRQELYDAFLKQLKEGGGAAEKGLSKEERQKKAMASLAAREDEVKRQQQQSARKLDQAKAGTNRQEAEREFRTLLIDAVRSHETRWRDVEENLSRDTRFHLPGLTPDLRSRLWDEHMSSLSSRRQGSLESLFERFTATEAKRLDVPFAQIWPKIESDPAVQHLHRSRDEIQEMYEDWLDQRVRVQAKRDLEECMAENSFVEYWGRLKRDARAKDEGTIEEEGSGDGDVEVVDVKQMSQKIDLNEIAAVLKHDKRFQVLDYDPALRERWMRAYLENLSAPTQTVYQQAAEARRKHE